MITNTHEKFCLLLFQTNNWDSLNISSTFHFSLTMMNTINNKFSSVDVWFRNQASKAIKIEDNVNLMLIIW